MFSHRGVSTGAAAILAIGLSWGAAAAQNWTGFYLGASAGGGTSKDNWDINNGGAVFSDRGHGGLAGLQTGYNWQSGSILLGLEADYLWSGIKGSTDCPGGGFTCGHDLKGLGSARARLGWVAAPSAMIYFTGGLGWGSSRWTAKDSVTGSLAGGGATSRTSTGWALGGGVEFLLNNNWTVKGEYLHYDFGRFSASPADFGGTPVNFKLSADTFKIGLNYKF